MTLGRQGCAYSVAHHLGCGRREDFEDNCRSTVLHGLCVQVIFKDIIRVCVCVCVCAERVFHSVDDFGLIRLGRL